MLSTLKKINFLITKRQRKGLVILTLLLFLAMILEIVGLGILFPLISILLEPELIGKTPLLAKLRNQFSELSQVTFLILILLSFVFFYILKSLFLIYLTYKQNRFLNNITSSLSVNLFQSYLNKPYSFHLNTNAAQLIKNIQVEFNYFFSFLMALITIFIEGGFVIAILATLIYIEPIGAVSISVFYGALTLLFLRFTKKRLKFWSNLRESVDSQLSKNVLEGIGGIKDLMILGKAPFFLNQFSKNANEKARLSSNQGTISLIPRYYLELISVVGIISFILIMVIQGRDVTNLISVLGIFVAAIFRIVPSLNKIIASSQSLKYHEPSLNIIYNEIKSHLTLIKKDFNLKRFKFQNFIKFDNISFYFKKNHTILNEVNFEIKKGQTIGIIGESGSGKSTLVDILLGLHHPTAGKIIIDGKDNFQLNQSWRNNIGYVSQSIYLTDDTIKNNIAFGVPENDIDLRQVDKLLKQVQLTTLIDNLELGINTKVGERGVQLSGGQRQRIGIARAMYHDPDILILDEATSALDSETENEVMQFINNLSASKTIIIIAHRLSTLELCENIFKVVNKKVINS